MTPEVSEEPAVAQPKIGLSKQLLVFVAMSMLALLLIYLQQSSVERIFKAGQPPALQMGFGLAAGACSALMAWVAYKLQKSNVSTRSVVTSYSRLELSGFNPVLLALAAGFGEELLFRAALQPLLGVLLASLIFVVAHVRAYQMKALTRTTLVQASGLFASGIFLGLIFQYVGLIAAIFVHVSIDIAGLYTVRCASSRTAD